MILPNLLIATVAILAPDVRLDAPPCPLWALQGVAVQMELMSAHESTYTFAHPDSFRTDLEYIRRRAVELADAPPAGDASRLPAHEYCREALDLAAGYRNHLEQLRLIDHSAWIDEAMAETERLRCIWSLASEAGCDYYGVYYRRIALRDLRDRIGPQLYYAGCMPPPVPTWRLTRGDQ